MKLREALRSAEGKLTRADAPNPKLDAETLLMHVLGRDRAFLIVHADDELAAEQTARFDEAVARRAKGEPIQYITGNQEFWGLDFEVSPAVLIPRPETEHSVEAALDLLRAIERPRIVDVGTGSGCIALALASELPNAEIHALDISEEALSVARRNAQRLGLQARVSFAQSDLLKKFSGERESFDLVVSNPPYVGTSQADSVQREVREHEPHIAVFGGEQGAEIYQRLIPQAFALLKPGAWLVLEIGYSMEEQVRSLLGRWSDVKVRADLQGIPRVVVARKPLR